MKKLILIRHAKSSWKDPTLSDLQRPLKKRGERNAREMAERLMALDLKVDKVFMSPALRVTQTIDLMTEETGFGAGITVISPDLYSFGYDDLLLFLKELDNSSQCIAVAGHNPAVTELVNFLSGADIPNIPTCGIAVLELNVDKWSALGAGKAKLVHYDYPKNDTSIEV